MKFKIQVTTLSDQDEALATTEIAVLGKDFQRIEHLGLTLAESKEILRRLQAMILAHQVAQFLAAFDRCWQCGDTLKTKGYHTIGFRTLFGDVPLASPRLHACPCSPSETQSCSPLAFLLRERSSPELLYIQTKWASLVSYGLTVKALKDFLPIDERLNTFTIRRQILTLTERCEAVLGPERVIFARRLRSDQALVPEGGFMAVGIDEAFLRGRRAGKLRERNFQVVAGKSVPGDRKPNYFGFVQAYDSKPKRRVFELLKSQGMQDDQKVYFLSDGADRLRRLQRFLHPHAEHNLDWFHLTMRITVLGQYVKGLIQIDPVLGEEVQKKLNSVKWKLWHGKYADALDRCLDMSIRLIHFRKTYSKYNKLCRALFKFRVFIEKNRKMLINYGEAWRAGRPISTGFVESTVNAYVAKRFSKSQQMRWTHRGAHLLLQMRAKTLNGDLAKTFRQWYPELRVEDNAQAA